MLATSPSSRSKKGAPQYKNATVMLGMTALDQAGHRNNLEVLCNMITNVGSSKNWIRHVNLRIEEAKKDGLIELNSILTPLTTCTVLPDGMNYENIDLIDPANTSLRMLSNEKIAADKWILRADFFEEAARMLHRHCERMDVKHFFFKSELSQPDDASLSSIDHVIFHNIVLYLVDIDNSNFDIMNRTMKKARSWRLTGFSGSFDNGQFQPCESGIFVCEALDGDSISMSDFSAHLAH